MDEPTLWSSQLPPEDMELSCDGHDSSDTLSLEIHEEVKESSEEMTEEEMTEEEREALGEQFDYDGSRLAPEQRKALFKSYFAMHLAAFDLRSPQYYQDKSQCLSVSESAWPGQISMLKAEYLRKGYIKPEELIERLRKLNPSDNFELRKFRHPPMSWKSPTPLVEEGFEQLPRDPDWLFDQLYAVNRMWRRLGRQLTAQYRQELRDRWAAVESSAEFTPLPDLHLLRDMGHSPGGTLFPWYLVKGIMTLRDHANEKGGKSYDEEYDSAMIKREEAINRWREGNPSSILADDPLSIYRTWPADLMYELDGIDREAIRCGSRKYVDLLKEAEEKMQTLVAFWTDCGLVTGKRTPPSPWWQDPKAKVDRLPKPQYLSDQLDAIIAEFGYFDDEGKKLRMIEMSRWIESIITTDSEPIASDTPFPPSLLDELDIIWRDCSWRTHDDTEDEMIARIRRWRKSKRQQGPSPQLGSDVGPEKKRRLRENLSRRARQPRMKIAMAEDKAIWRGRLRPRIKTEGQASWCDRLRPRSNAVSALRDMTKATRGQTGNPKGIVKRRKASKKRRPAPTRGQATNSATQNADLARLLDIQSCFTEGSSQAVPESIVKTKRTKKLDRQSPRRADTAQPQGIQKTRNSNRVQTRGVIGAALGTKRNQGFLPLLTPPQS
ncbi:hypothetical protein MMC30_002907 [Trapelia coarctata]|nr:hypothetical protein [Trapelia coarctata]